MNEKRELVKEEPNRKMQKNLLQVRTLQKERKKASCTDFLIKRSDVVGQKQMHAQPLNRKPTYHGLKRTN